MEPHGGRLDLILVDEAERRRYEVEVQLGRTDPSHIIRTIEYWDHERTARPTWDHVAVLVAEEVTSRFSNVIRLFNSTIPIMAIQLNALEIAGRMTIATTTVLDLSAIADDEEETGHGAEPATRADWEGKASPESLAMVDQLFQLVRETTGNSGIALKYNQGYIGLSRNGQADNFVFFGPRKGQTMLAFFRTPRTEEMTTRLEDAGLSIAKGYQSNRTVLRLTPEDLTKNVDTLRDLVRVAADLPQPLDADQDSES